MLVCILCYVTLFDYTASRTVSFAPQVTAVPGSGDAALMYYNSFNPRQTSVHLRRLVVLF